MNDKSIRGQIICVEWTEVVDTHRDHGARHRHRPIPLHSHSCAETFTKLGGGLGGRQVNSLRLPTVCLTFCCRQPARKETYYSLASTSPA